jgi:hypothetical protein
MVGAMAFALDTMVVGISANGCCAFDGHKYLEYDLQGAVNRQQTPGEQNCSELGSSHSDTVHKAFGTKLKW